MVNLLFCRKFLQESVEVAARLRTTADKGNRLRVLSPEILCRHRTQRRRADFGDPGAVHDGDGIGRPAVEQSDRRPDCLHSLMRVCRVHTKRLDRRIWRVFGDGQGRHEQNVDDGSEQTFRCVEDPFYVSLPAEMLNQRDGLRL